MAKEQPNFDVLEPQAEFVTDVTTKFLGLAGSYRAGKTYSLCLKALHMCHLNPGFDGLLLEPTHSMLEGVLCPVMEEVLNKAGFREGETYNYYSAASNPRFEIKIGKKWTKILLRSSENYERIRGFSIAWFGADEFDTSGQAICTAAWQKMVARLTKGNVMQGFITSTKEGYGWMYDFFVQQPATAKAKGLPELTDRRLIDIFVKDNPFIDDGYVELMRSQLSPKQFEAYVENKFCNFTSGNVYYCFDRNQNRSKESAEARPQAEILVGTDFNVGKMATIFAIENANHEIHVVDEVYGLENTAALIEHIRKRYPRRQVHCFPDASGSSSKTNATFSDVDLLRNAFGQNNVHHYAKNIGILDRVGAVNARFCAADGKTRKLFVNVDRCPSLTKCLEAQGFDDKGQPSKAGDIDHFPDALGYLVSHRYPIKNRQAQNIARVG